MDYKREGYERVRPQSESSTLKRQRCWGQEGSLGEHLEGMKWYKYDQKSWEQWRSPWMGEAEQSSRGAIPRRKGVSWWKAIKALSPSTQLLPLHWTLSSPRARCTTRNSSLTKSPLPTCAQRISPNSGKANAKKRGLCNEQIVELTPKKTGCRTITASQREPS